MKTTKFLSIILLFSIITSTTSYAQLQVLPSGRTIIGPERANDDPNNMTKLGLFGNSSYWSGAKLSFGDVGSSSAGLHAFIGEFGTYDSDILNPHGRNGIYFTIGGAADIVIAKMESNLLNVFGNVQSTGFITTSDIRLKKNVKPILLGISLSNIKKLNAITYDYKTEKDDSLLIELNKLRPIEEKEIKGVEQMKKDIAKKKILMSNQIGFSAQDLMKIYPELVIESTDGMLSVNYTGLIPVLVEAMKEQQALIDAQKATMDSQKATIDALQKDIIAIKKKIGME